MIMRIFILDVKFNDWWEHFYPYSGNNPHELQENRDKAFQALRSDIWKFHPLAEAMEVEEVIKNEGRPETCLYRLKTQEVKDLGGE